MASSHCHHHHPLPISAQPTPQSAFARPRRRSRRRPRAAIIIALIALALSANGLEAEAAAPARYHNANAPSTSYLPPASPLRRRDSYLPPPGSVQKGKRPPAQPTTDPIYFSSSHGSLYPFADQAGRAGDAGDAGAAGTNGKGKGKAKGKSKGKAKAKAAAAEQALDAPPDAFPYLSDIGLRHKVPFKSGMPQAGASWAEAGLRPNVDPKMPSERRPERKAPSRKTTGGGGGGGSKGISGGRVGGAGDNDGEASSSWRLAPEDPSRSSSSDADAAALAEEWSHQPAQPASPLTTTTATTSASSPSSSTHPPTPALLRLGSHLLSSSKQVWQWLAPSSSADHHDGIALTMLKPKVHRPVVAHLPLIPNDSKRDLVALIVGTLCVFALATMLWNSRVSPEEFARLKRLKEVGGADGSAARSPEVLATLGPGDEGRFGAASAAYSSSAAGRRRRVAKQQGGSEAYDVAAGSGDESDGDATLVGGMPGWAAAAAGRRPKPVSRSSTDSIGGGRSRSSGGFFGGWLGGWSRSGRSSSRSDGAIALPLLGDIGSSSRSSTPRAPHLVFDDQHHHDFDGLASASVATPTAGRRWGLPTPSSIQSALVAATAPSTPATELPAAATTSESGSSSFFASRPFRSLTPQPPQTQRQRERDRSRERRRRAREEREQMQQQQHLRGASDEAALSVDLEDGTIGDDVLAGLPLRSASANSHRSWAAAAAALRWGGVGGGDAGSSSTSTSSNPSANASANSSIDGLASISVGSGTYQADGGWRNIRNGESSGSSSRAGTPRIASGEQLKRPGFRWAATSDEQAGGGVVYDGVGGGNGAPLHASAGDQQHYDGSEGYAVAGRWKGKGRDV